MKKIKNLLVTEDDKVLIRFYEQALAGICEKLLVVGNSSEALNILKNQQIDFLITDLKLEENDGLDIVNCAIKYNTEIQILVASGYVTDAKYHDPMKAIPQVGGYLQKPFTIEVLMAKIEAMVGDVDNPLIQ